MTGGDFTAKKPRTACRMDAQSVASVLYHWRAYQFQMISGFIGSFFGPVTP